MYHLHSISSQHHIKFSTYHPVSLELCQDNVAYSWPILFTCLVLPAPHFDHTWFAQIWVGLWCTSSFTKPIVPNKCNITAFGKSLIALTHSNCTGCQGKFSSTMSTKEELCNSILSCLNNILGDAMKTTCLVWGEHISAQKMQKLRYLFGPAFPDLLTFSGWGPNMSGPVSPNWMSSPAIIRKLKKNR